MLAYLFSASQQVQHLASVLVDIPVIRMAQALDYLGEGLDVIGNTRHTHEPQRLRFAEPRTANFPGGHG